MRASSEAACPSHFATVMLGAEEPEEEEEEEDPPALRFRPPALPVLRRFEPPRELIAAVRAVQFGCRSFFVFPIGVFDLVNHS